MRYAEKLLSKIETFVKNRNFCQKAKLFCQKSKKNFPDTLFKFCALHFAYPQFFETLVQAYFGGRIGGDDSESDSDWGEDVGWGDQGGFDECDDAGEHKTVRKIQKINKNRTSDK